MSDLRFPRWQPIAAAPVSSVYLANAGVVLSRAPSSIIVTALGAPPLPMTGLPLAPPPFAMPMITSDEVRRCANFLRSLYRHNGCRAGMALYLDITTSRWLAVLPQQLATPSGYRANLRDVAAARLPASGLWRLAGSVQSVVMGGDLGPAATYMDELPGFDGVHVLIDPRHVFFPRVILRLDGDEYCEVEPATVLSEAATGFESQVNDVWCKGGDV